MSELEEKKKSRSKSGGTKDGKGSKSKGYNLRDWFKGGGWVQVGGKYDGKPCAKQPGQKTKPYCRDPDDRSKMGKKEKEKRAKKKRKEDPNPNRRGKAKNVSQKSKKRKNESMHLTTEQITKIIIEELHVVLNEQDDIASKLDRLYDAKDEGSKSQMRQILASLSDDPGVGRWIDSKVEQLDAQISQVQAEIDKWEKIVEDLEKAGMDPDNYYADEAAEDAFHTFESEVWPRRQQKNQLEQEKKMLTSDEMMESRKKRKAARKRKKAKTTKKDACYRKVKSRYKVWPSAYASGALVKCRKVGAKNWGNKSKKNESLNEEYINEEEMSDEDRKELERIRDKLYGASKAHKGQADDLDKMLKEQELEEAEYRGRKVKLNKPMRGDVKKFKVYVKDPKTGNVKKVNFGHGGTSAKKKGEKTMKIRKSNPKARKSFRARHNCDNPGPKTKARYWSCRKW